MKYTVNVCDLCGKEQRDLPLINIVINTYYRGTYENNDKEHYCCDFDVCSECAEKYQLCKYKRIDENIEFVKENYKFLSKIRKLVKGLKEDRVKN